MNIQYNNNDGYIRLSVTQKMVYQNFSIAKGRYVLKQN